MGGTGAERLDLPSTFRFNQIVEYFFHYKDASCYLLNTFKMFHSLKNTEVWARKK